MNTKIPKRILRDPSVRSKDGRNIPLIGEISDKIAIDKRTTRNSEWKETWLKKRNEMKSQIKSLSGQAGKRDARNKPRISKKRREAMQLGINLRKLGDPVSVAQGDALIQYAAMTPREAIQSRKDARNKRRREKRAESVRLKSAPAPSIEQWSKSHGCVNPGDIKGNDSIRDKSGDYAIPWGLKPESEPKPQGRWGTEPLGIPKAGFKVHCDAKTARFLAGTDTEQDRIEEAEERGYRRGVEDDERQSTRLIETLIASGAVSQETVDAAMDLVTASNSASHSHPTPGPSSSSQPPGAATPAGRSSPPPPERQRPVRSGGC